MSERTIVVSAGEHHRENCPVYAKLEGILSSDDETICLIDPDSEEIVPSQIFCRKEGTVNLAWIVGQLEKGGQKKYTLKVEKSDKCKCGCEAGTVELNTLGDEKVEIKIGGELFSNYYFGKEYARPFMHPFIGPHGKSVTRDFPMVEDAPGETKDHKHHRSVWVAWGDVNGVDDWSEEEGHGRVVHQSFHRCCSGSVLGHIVETNHWVSSEGKKVLEEDRQTTIYNLPGSARAVDLTVTFRATEGKVRFGDTKEGGIASVRVATTMDANKGGTIVNSYGGANEAETWGKRAHWCDYSGPVDGETVGVTIFDHPDNFRYPTYWHVRDYGLMTANPFGVSHFKNDESQDGSFELDAGGVLRFQYRIYIHSGNVQEGRVAEKYHDFINPPAIAVE